MKIGLYDNKIYDDDDTVTVKRKFDTILKDIRDHVELEEIYLEGNNLVASHVDDLEKSLVKHRNLKILNLSANLDIHADAVPALKRIISQHPKLELTLRYNKMTDEDIRILTEGNSPELQEKIHSTTFNFTCNSITEKGLVKAEGALSPDSILSMLSGNSIINEPLMDKVRHRAFEKLQIPIKEKGPDLISAFNLSKADRPQNPINGPSSNLRASTVKQRNKK